MHRKETLLARFGGEIARLTITGGWLEAWFDELNKPARCNG